MTADVLIIGAGLSGLAAAGELTRQGHAVLVLEKSKAVGGRCATRRVDGHPVDHGLVFLHGQDPSFLAALEDLDAGTPIPGWPQRIAGSGLPCQPGAFSPTQRRLAFQEGLNVFPKRLAQGLDIRLGIDVESLARRAGMLIARTAGKSFEAPTLILSLPVEQARCLIQTLEAPEADLRAPLRLLSMVGSLPCLTLLAGYPSTVPLPDWDLFYPEASPVFQLIAHDSAKRPSPAPLNLVFQARPGWSNQHLETSPETWQTEMLTEAGRLLGPWAAAPTWSQPHRWRYARVDQGTELARPMIIPLSDGTRLGLAGELFAPGGGAEAAWLSGRALARRLCAVEEDR